MLKKFDMRKKAKNEKKSVAPFVILLTEPTSMHPQHFFFCPLFITHVSVVYPRIYTTFQLFFFHCTWHFIINIFITYFYLRQGYCRQGTSCSNLNKAIVEPIYLEQVDRFNYFVTDIPFDGKMLTQVNIFPSNGMTFTR